MIDKSIRLHAFNLNTYCDARRYRLRVTLTTIIQSFYRHHSLSKSVYEKWDQSDHHFCVLLITTSCRWSVLRVCKITKIWSVDVTLFCCLHVLLNTFLYYTVYLIWILLLRLKSEIGTFEDVGDHVLLSRWRVCLFESLPTQLEYVFFFESGVVLDVILSKWLLFIWKLCLSCVHT